MLKYKDKLFNNRKELKDYLGGTYYYNKCFYSGEIEFINKKKLRAMKTNQITRSKESYDPGIYCFRNKINGKCYTFNWFIQDEIY